MKLALGILAFFVAFSAFAAREKKLDRPVQTPAQRLTVTLDVKDAEVRDVLKSMQSQCAIKNLIVDPQVQGKATFFLRELPCGKAFDIVLRTYGLKSVIYSNTLTAVEPRR